MTKTAAELAADIIVAEGLGTLAGAWPVATGKQALSPTDVLTTYDSGGLDRLLHEEDLRRPSVQVRIRSEDYRTGWQKANEILRTLGTLSNYELVDGLETDRIVGFAVQGDVLFAGRDAQSLHLFTVNFNLTRDMSQ